MWWSSEAAGMELVFREPLLGLAAGALAAAAVLAYLAAARRAARLEPLYGRVPPRVQVLLLVAALSLLALAAAEPVARIERVLEGGEALRAAVEHPSAVVVVLDVSRSMGYGSRFREALTGVEALLSSLPSTATVLVYKFSGLVEGPVCINASGCASILEALRPVERFSAVGDAVLAGVAALRSTGLPGVVVVATDGGWNRGVDPRDALEEAVASGAKLVVYLVGDDPRAAGLLEAARRLGVPVVRDPARLAAIVERLRAEAVVEANGGRLRVTEYTPVPLQPILAAAALLLAALQACRPGGAR